TLIARNELPDTIIYLKGHRNRYLCRTPQGAYFLYLLTESYFGAGRDPDPEIKPLTKEGAMTEYKYLDDQRVGIEAAFP
ncbi:MAG: hypothetical protein ACXVI1_10740, partial [Halobacteriota archaeon]